MRQVWAGIDAGKTRHHCVVISADGKRVFSRRIPNDEEAQARMIADVAALGEVKTWAIDLNAGGAAVAITLLINAGQPLLYISGRVVNRAACMYRGHQRGPGLLDGDVVAAHWLAGGAVDRAEPI